MRSLNTVQVSVLFLLLFIIVTKFLLSKNFFLSISSSTKYRVWARDESAEESPNIYRLAL